MPLSGTRLKGAQKAGILAQLQILFPIDEDLLESEQATLVSVQDDIAEAIAYGSGPETVTEVTGNAAVVGVVGSGVGAGGTVSGTVT